MYLFVHYSLQNNKHSIVFFQVEVVVVAESWLNFMYGQTLFDDKAQQ